MSLKNFFWKDTEPKKQDIDHFTANVNDQDKKLFEDFIGEYNPSGDLKFNEVPFRKGAKITGQFGLDEGFKLDKKGEMEWGYVRDHTGVDRASGGSRTIGGELIEDIVEVPFNFDRSSFIDYGDKSYGTLISLFNDRFGFEFRIAHMNPDRIKRKGNEKGSIIPWSLDRLKRKMSFNQGWVLGSAGTWGASTGAHTHTEIKSLDESCEVFDILLYELFKDEALKEYPNDEVYNAYRKQKNFKSSSLKDILRDYNELRKERKIIFINRFKTQYVDWDGTVKSRYSTNLLFNGL